MHSEQTSMESRHFDALLDLSTLVAVASFLVGDAEITSEELAIVNLHRVDVSSELIEATKVAISNGTDPLGTAYCVIRSPQERRGAGQTFTPLEAVVGMFNWADTQGQFDRIVDPGSGSGRYVLHGLRQYPNTIGVAAEMDPLVALLLRANASALGVGGRLRIHVGDYRTLQLGEIEGKTLFIGNPPYVRHHDISALWKKWYSDHLKSWGHSSSKLAGLHLHFFVQTLNLARQGDIGCFITAAEWLDVNYGQSLRELLTNGLGGKAVFVVSPEIPIFGDALVTACITCFAPGAESDLLEFKSIQSVAQLRDLSGGHFTSKMRAKSERSWSVLLRNEVNVQQEGFVQLGDLFNVRRGQVTGKNSVWVTNDNRFGLPEEFLVPAITDAADIILAPGSRIESLASLRRVIDLPPSLEDLEEDKLRAVQNFLDWARSEDADKGYIATHRKPWWRVNMRDVPQIVVTYMGRRPPVFALNSAGASLINVAHGLYPKVNLSEQTLNALIDWLNSNISKESGRVYAGGLTKFEPSEIKRLQVPAIAMLEANI